jgi:lysophospholipase
MLQSLPLWTQIQPARHPDFIVTWDDGEGELTPTALVVRSLHIGRCLSFWLAQWHESLGHIPLRQREQRTVHNRSRSRNFRQSESHLEADLLGCDANLTTTNDLRAPNVLYLANSPYSSYTNYSGNSKTYSDEDMAVIMKNSFNILTEDNSTLDQEWPECLGCAVID